MWRCAGANVGILEGCETDHSRYTNIGATILLTALLASVSMAFAIHSIFESYWIAGAVGLLWGCMIFVLDRTIVTSMRKRARLNLKSQGGESVYGGEVKWYAQIGEYFRELMFLCIRLTVAILVALVITKPLEIKIFEGRLEVELENMKTEQWKRDSVQPGNQSGIPLKEQILAGMKHDDSLLASRIAAREKSPEYLALEKKHSECIAGITPEINKRYNSIQFYQSLIDSKKRNPLVAESPASIEMIRDWNAEITKANKEIAAFQARCFPMEKEMQEEEKRYAQELQSQHAANQGNIFTQNQELQDARKDAGKKFNELKAIREKSFGNSLIPQIEALESLKSHEPSIWWTSMLITLLFIAAELSPVLAKLISKRGAYDDALETYELQQWLIRQAESAKQIHSLNAATELSMAELEQQRRTLEQQGKAQEEDHQASRKAKVQLDTRKQAAAAEKELTSYKDLVEKIALAQKEIALVQIEQWRREQMAKLNGGTE